MLRVSKADCAVFVTLLLTVPCLASAASGPVQTKDPRIVEAQTLYHSGNYQKAAERYEMLWAEKPEPKSAKFLWNAALSRELAGQDARAFVLLSRYLRLRTTLLLKERKQAQQRLIALQARTVRLSLRPTPTVDAKITLEHRAFPQTDAAKPLMVDTSEFQTLDGVTELYVEPGFWQVTVEAADASLARATLELTHLTPVSVDLALKPIMRPVAIAIHPLHAMTHGLKLTAICENVAGNQNERITQSPILWQLPTSSCELLASSAGFRPATYHLEAGPSSTTVQFQLVEEQPRSQAMDLAVLGLASSSGIIGGTGLVLGTITGIQLQRTLDAKNWYNPARSSLAQMTDAGFMLVGSGLGLATNTLIRRFAPPKKRLMWLVPGVSSAVFLTTGTLLAYLFNTKLIAKERELASIPMNERNEVDAVQSFNQLSSLFAGRTGGFFLLGTGSGLLVGAIVGAVCHKRCERKLNLSAASAGVMLSF